MFISYKAERKNAAEHLRHILEAHGFSVWYDYQLKTGTDFDLQIMRELNAAKAVVVLWDTMSASSPWVKLEAMTALYNDTYVPVMIENCTLDTEFAKVQCEDLLRWSAEPAAYRPESLIETLEEKLGRHATADRTALKSLHEEWRKYGSQSLEQFALTAVPDKREAEKTPPIDLDAAAKDASRQTSKDKRMPHEHRWGWLAALVGLVLALVAGWFVISPAPSPVSLSSIEKEITEVRYRRTLKDHEGWVWSAQFSPDGATAFIGSDDNVARLWSVDTGETLAILRGHEDDVRSVAFSPDGKIVLTGSYDGTARLWSLDTGQTLSTLKDHENSVWSVAFSPDGRTALTGSGDRTARLWSVDTGETLASLKDHTGWVISVAFSPDGMTALTGSGDRTARLWSIETGETIQTLKGHGDAIISVAFSPDGTTALTGSTDKTAVLWSLETGDPRYTLKGHEGGVSSVAFSPNGKTALTGSWDKTARLWNLETGETLTTLKGHKSEINSVAFSLDGKMIVTGSSDGTARLWDVIYE